jgi:tetratricopeptide (TPR) repeat protein
VLVRLYSPYEQPVAALIDSPAKLRCWLNGRLQPEAAPGRPPDAEDDARPMTLRAGWNTLLFRVGLGTGKDRLSLWLSDEPADRVHALADCGRWDEALTLVKEVKSRQPNEVAALLLEARCFRRHADSLRRQGQGERAAATDREARSCYEKLLVLHPDNASCAAELAEFLLPESWGWEILDTADTSAAGGSILSKLADGSILASGKTPCPETYTVTARAKVAGITAFRLEVLTDLSLPRSGPGRASDGNLVLNDFRINAATAGSPSRTEPVVLDKAWADFSQGGFPVEGAIDGDPETGWALAGETGRAHVAVFTSKAPLGNTADTLLTFTLVQRHAHEFRDYTIGRFRLSATARPQALREEQRRSALARHDLRGRTKLAAVLYLRGEWQSALAVLKPSAEAPSGGNGWDRLLLALIHTELGHPDEAAKWGDDALAWMAENGDDEPFCQFAADSLSGRLARKPQADSAEVRVGRARAFLVLKQPDKAIAEATKAVKLQPKNLAARQVRGAIYLGLKKWDAALEDYNVLVEIEPDNAEFLETRANLLARGGQLTQAAADFKRLPTMPFQNPRPWHLGFRHALALLGAGKTTEYRQACAAMLDQFKDTDDPDAAFFAAWTGALAPDAVPDFTLPLRLAERALAQDAERANYLQGLGAILYRAQRFPEALERFQSAEGKPNSQNTTSFAYIWYFRAMTHFRLGQQEEAEKWLAKANAQADQELPGIDLNLQLWVRKATLQLLRAEAEKLLSESSKPMPEPQAKPTR